MGKGLTNGSTATMITNIIKNRNHIALQEVIVHGIVHEYLLRNEPPTVKKLLGTVKERLGDRFTYGEEFLRRLLHKLGLGRRKGRGEAVEIRRP